MPRRSAIGLDAIADLETLSWALWRAAQGKRDHPEVTSALRHPERWLATLADDLHQGRAPEGRYRTFSIFDPKPRKILAPCFRDRVVHHAMMVHMGPVLDRALVDDTFACRTGRGTLAAVQRAQQHVRRFPWFVKADVRAYFASIDHAVLLGLLRRRFKNPELLALCERILTCTPDGFGVGLPIGALTSQHFANTYLDGLDRYLLEQLRVRGLVRYMDDLVWWCDDRDAARLTRDAVIDWAKRERALEIKSTAQIGRSKHGVSLLGFRILPESVRLSLRRRRRYTAARARWESAYHSGQIDAVALQSGIDAALAITAHADAIGWRRAELQRHPPLDA